MSYRPDLLFHQQYATRYGSKVTRCQMPSDTVPTVTRLAPEPRGDGVSASIRRRWGWMGGMVNTCELLINVVTSGKPKMLRGLGQKGTVAGTGSQIPSDLVVKSQATDIIDLILQLIRHQNGVHRSCRNRTSRGAVLSTSEVQWATTKFDGV